MSHPVVLDSLTTREAIIDAVYRTVLGVDGNDYELFKSAWLEGSVVSVNVDGSLLNGTEQIKENFFDRIGPLDTTHTLSNIRVDVNGAGDTARLTAEAIAQHYKPGQGLDPGIKGLLTGTLHFIDLVNECGGEGWKIRNWTLKTIWREGDMSVLEG